MGLGAHLTLASDPHRLDPSADVLGLSHVRIAADNAMVRCQKSSRVGRNIILASFHAYVHSFPGD